MDIRVSDVIKTLKAANRHKHLYLLLSNKDNNRIIFSSNAYYYHDDKSGFRILHGLLPTLKRNYWPNSNIKSIMEMAKKSNTLSNSKKTLRFKSNKTKKTKKNLLYTNNALKKHKENKETILKGKGKFFGTIQGTRIHHELEDAIILDYKNFKKKYGNLHPFTERILLYLRAEMKWIPIRSEFKVYDKDNMIGTAIDMICVNPINGHLVFIEFKTGYKTYFETYDGFLERCLKDLKNSPLNWATIQLTASVIMLLNQNPSLSIENTSSYVIRIDDENIDSYLIDNEFIRIMQDKLLHHLT